MADCCFWSPTQLRIGDGWTTLTKDSCSCASEALDAVGASVHHCGAETRLSGRQHPEEEQTGEKRQLEGTKPTDEHTPTYAQACFTPQRTNSSFWHFGTLILPQSTTLLSAIYLGYHSLHKLSCRCCLARRGVRGHCKPTPSRPLCSFHPHQPAACMF